MPVIAVDYDVDHEVRPKIRGKGFRAYGLTSGYVGVKSPAAPTSWTFVLPGAAPGTNGYLLAGNTDGTTSWVAPPSGSGANTALSNLASVAINTPLVFPTGDKSLVTCQNSQKLYTDGGKIGLDSAGSSTLVCRNDGYVYVEVGGLIVSSGDVFIAATKKHGFDSGGDTNITKSANSGGNFDRSYDGTIFERNDGSRLGFLASMRAGPDSAIGTSMGVFYTTMFTSTADCTVANTTTQTTLFASGVGTRTIPASYVRVGSRYRVRLVGLLSTKTVAPGNITFDIKVGTVVIATVTVGITGALSNSKIEIEAEFVVRATGSTGNVMAWGEVENQVVALAADLSYAMTNTAVSADINFTVTNVINGLVTFATADAANSITIQCATVEVAN